MVALETPKRNTDRSSIYLIEVWDIEKANLVETYVTRTGPSADPILDPPEVAQGAEKTAAGAIAALVHSRQNKSDLSEMIRPREELLQQPAQDIRAMVVGSDFGVYTSQRPEFGELEPTSSRSSGRGFVLTGSEDAKIRLWDLGKIEKTTVLSGLDHGHEKPSYGFVFFPFLAFSFLISDTAPLLPQMETQPPSSSLGHEFLQVVPQTAHPIGYL